jgi:hypothetical protein
VIEPMSNSFSRTLTCRLAVFAGAMTSPAQAGRWMLFKPDRPEQVDLLLIRSAARALGLHRRAAERYPVGARSVRGYGQVAAVREAG